MILSYHRPVARAETQQVRVMLEEVARIDHTFAAVLGVCLELASIQRIAFQRSERQFVRRHLART